MPPRVKITKEDIINSAVDIARKSGVQAVNARTIASALDCSTQPVFSNFASMEDLHRAVVDVAEKLYEDYTKEEMKSGKYPAYKSTGMAYIRFAREEKELFKLLFMRDRSSENIPSFSKKISDLVRENTGLCEKSAELFHLEMWAFVHGIATMTATDYLDLDTELVSAMVTDIYQGMMMRYKAKGEL